MSSDPVPVLLQAAADDNIIGLSQKLSNTTTSTHIESLLLACKRPSINYMKEINRLRPHLACNKDNNGYTILHHLIEDKFPVSIIEDLIKYHPRGFQLGNEADNQWTTPFHMAAKQGRTDILKVLIKACGSDFLSRVTCLHQTVFHLAIENGQFGCFDVMMEDLLKGDDEQLTKTRRVLSMKDHNGNTVLHIAVDKKQTYISGYLLADNPKRRPLVEVHVKNNSGLTALEIHDQNSPERDDRRIRGLLIGAGPHDQINVVASMEIISHNNSEALKMTSLTRKSLLMASLTVFAAVAFGSLSVYRSIFTEGTQPVPPNANLFTFRLLPSGFFYLTFVTVTFVVCMCVILGLVWSLDFQYWPTFGRPIFLFLWAAIQIVFGLAVKELMPDFSVTTFGAHRISSLRLLGFYMAAILLSFFIFVFIMKLTIDLVSEFFAYLVEEFW